MDIPAVEVVSPSVYADDIDKGLSNNKKYTNYVNPFIGTGGHGHTFPGAVVPFGMVQLSPDTRNDASWDACGGYYYNDSTILGFSHTHLSGTGVSDFGDILFQPTDGPKFDPKDYREAYLHRDEVATPGYYSVRYRRSRIKTELTASDYTGIQRYTFDNSKEAWVIIDLEHRDELLSFSLELENFSPGENIEKQGIYRLKGHRRSKAWANNQWVFFVTEFSQPILKYQYNENKTKLALCFRKGWFSQQDSLKLIDTHPQIPEERMLKIPRQPHFVLDVMTTISFTSIEGAERNEQYTLGKLKEKLKI
jgi:putative alpha-1,2-mannosidase